MLHGITSLISDTFWTVFPPLLFVGVGIVLANLYEICVRQYKLWKWRKIKTKWEASYLRKINHEAEEAKDAAKRRIAFHATAQANERAHAKQFGHTR